MRWAVLLVLGLVVAGCAEAPLGTPTPADRRAAEQFAAQSILDRFPDYPEASVGAVANCIGSHATDDETMLLAGQSVTANEKSRRTLAVAIARRADTAACIRSNNVPPLA